MKVGAGLPCAPQSYAGLVALAVVGFTGCWTSLDLSDKHYILKDVHAGMVHVQTKSLDFWIDATEVTNAAYKAWLDTNPDASSPFDPRCQVNHSFQPGKREGLCDCTGDTTCDSFANDPGLWAATAASSPNRPVACVDWCDALSYCEARGARLCAASMGASITLNCTNPPDCDPIPAFVASDSEWYAACGGPSMQAYPYGSTYNAAACNTENSATTDVGTPTCVGGYPGIFDMSGNVMEWVDACYAPDGSCARVGGAYYAGAADVTCHLVNSETWRCQSDTTGFRCCAD
jgi:formylglycine-generating enzyme required for sulfatase activity